MDPNYFQGAAGGEVAHTLTMSEMAHHNHFVYASSAQGNNPNPGGALLGSPLNLSYRLPDTGLVNLDPKSIGIIGGGQPHENRQPSLVVNFCIALQGVFPTQN
jgi:microcystin-dependent protein